MGCRYCSWFNTQDATGEGGEVGQAPDPFPNGKCPRKCGCKEKYYGEVCEYISDEVEEYDYKLENMEKPVPEMPCEEDLRTVATRRYWIEKGVDMGLNPHTDLDLGWPLPTCMHVLYKSIGEMVTEWEEKVVRNDEWEKKALRIEMKKRKRAAERKKLKRAPGDGRR